jgi:hypothetical protein
VGGLSGGEEGLLAIMDRVVKALKSEGPEI